MFNNAAQVWNHTFYWNCLTPNGGGEPTGALADAINKAFGASRSSRKNSARPAIGTFGSGWGWLVQRPDGSPGPGQHLQRRHAAHRRRHARC